MVIRRVYGFQILLHGGAVVQVFFPQFQRIVLHVAGGERLAVMPFNALPQRKGDAFAVRRGLPPGCQLRHHVAQCIQIHQGFNNLAGDDVYPGRCAQRRVKNTLLRSQMNAKRTPFHRGARCRRPRSLRGR
ncbi:hypothetical protein CS369_02455 [Candidatus Symbiopectobacterium sp. 'North America']|nr:hypothetical protein [Candidatus Symbiopectobacterium sp. 'North America']